MGQKTQKPGIIRRNDGAGFLTYPQVKIEKLIKTGSFC